MIRTELRPYQDVASRAACAYDGYALFPEQRTGKCLISLAILNRIRPETLVIICPKKAVLTWETEIDLHLDLDWECDIFILTYQELVKNLKLRQKWYRWSKEFVDHGGRLMVIADEAHYIKKPGTAQSRVVRTLGKRAIYRLALTGTPIDKNYEQFWAIIDFIQHGTAFPPTFQLFKDIYCNYETVFNKSRSKSWPELVGYNHEDTMQKIIRKFSFRVTFNEARRSIDKQPVRIHRRKEYFDLNSKSRTLYNEMKKDLEVVLDDLVIDAPLPITLIQKLQQICGGFLLYQQRIPGERKRQRIVVNVGDEKMTKLMQVCSGLGSEKAVICCRYTHEIEAIRKKFDEFNWTYKEISGNSEWDGDFDVDFVILQVKGGLGFDLSEASTLIFYSWDHSYITFEQSRFRVMNMKTTTKVNYHFLIARDSIEEDYYQAIAKKKEFSSVILDHRRREEREATASVHKRRIRRTRKQTAAA